MNVDQYDTHDEALRDLAGLLVQAEELVMALGWSDNRLGRHVPLSLRRTIRDALPGIRVHDSIRATMWPDLQALEPRETEGENP